MLALGCGNQRADEETKAAVPASDAAPSTPANLDLSQMEPQVKARLLETRSAALANPLSAEAWGRYGMVAHAHELWAQAAPAYRQAEKLDPKDARWPYYLGDVLSVQGTALEEAVASFRRAMALRPDYAPAHMRLGKVLIELDRGPEAAIELQRALELAPDLQQARVALAQVWLANGELEASEKLLEQVLEAESRHGQALATLGRVYMRQNRREEAREVAERARDAASFNLFSDPLMGQVVGEGVSAVQIWERAKGFLEKKDYVQAALGLQRVVALQPSNVEAHLQLALTFGKLGELARSRQHFERVVALDPEQVEPRLDLAQLLLGEGRSTEAVQVLRDARRLAPSSAEIGWQLGRALVESGDLPDALEVFEAERRAGHAAPPWADTAWGRALAQTGRPQEALDHFRAALLQKPDDAETHFYLGLVLEGLGRIDEAVESYCRSQFQRHGSPASARLAALRRACP